MKIKTPKDNLIALPMEILPRLKGATGTELKVLLYLFAKKEADTPELATQLGITPAEAEGAVAFWRGAGIIEPDESAEKKPVPSGKGLYKSYDSQTIAEHREKDAAFCACCDMVAESFGKQLTKNDYSSLLYLCDYVNLPPEMVSGIAAYCVSRGKRSMQYLMSTALGMYEQDGIDTYEKFERHLAKLEQLHSSIDRVRKMCGFGDRELTSKERTLLDTWFEKWDLSFELVRLAYEKMIDTQGKVNLPYMNGILKRWYESGFTTPDDVKSKDSKPAGAGDASYGDSDAFFEAALKAGFEGD